MPSLGSNRVIFFYSIAIKFFFVCVDDVKRVAITFFDDFLHYLMMIF